ncbi:MAG: hypothetical protein A3K75_01670 [Euryarchaeota archaeon RBG_13_61_15]|nr:MAG: hypothetical protein A3K75_01670 [Euryarchaeota archaeon RBG_13_61_15]
MPIDKKKLRMVRMKARIASKVQEKDLISKAKLLMDEPDLILPDCDEECGSCPFRKTKRRLDKIGKYKTDPHKVAKFANRGDRLARAYAATISLAHEEKAPYLASAKYPGGTITYAVRGKTSKEKLIGVQNFDSPKWRVLSVVDLVKKKGLHFYSYGDNFVCTGRRSAAPEEYVNQAAESIGATRVDGEVHTCPHNPSAVNHIEFDWVSSGRRIILCDQCAIKSKNTLTKLAEGMAVPRVLSEFDIKIRRPLRRMAGDTDCSTILDKPVSEDLLEKYSSGQIGDRELIDGHLEEVRDALKKENKRAFVRGDRCFGEDMEAFVKDMSSDDVEARALRGLLSGIDHPIVVDDGDSVNRLISSYWTDRGMDVLKEFVPEKVAKKHFTVDAESVKSPLKIVRQAMKEAAHTEVSSKIPSYSGLSQHGKFVDGVVRAYKTKGPVGANAFLDADKSTDHRTRSIAHSFYLALGVSTKSWRFTEEEKQFGKHLQKHAQSLLESGDQDQHHEAFATYLREAGSTEDLKLV